MTDAPPSPHHQAQEAPQEAVSQLVVIGSSAGGVDALIGLVAKLPLALPAPIIVAQHLDPRRESHLGEILASRSVLPVRTVNNRERLEPGVVYVVGADLNVEVSDHVISVEVDPSSSPKPSIDRLMTSAARIYSDNLIAVILTGTGRDGAAGAQAVKAHGGTVIVQNPETASFPGMPLAVPPSVVDIVADLEAIGSLLGDLLSGADAIPPATDDGELQAFLERVRERTGLDFSAYKRPTIVRRLHRRMVAVDAADLKEYRRYLERHPEELQRLATSFLIKVTEFFRDPELFAYLRDQVLPRLIAEARERGELRIWSAGCATGEEAYTLAMLIHDLLAGDEHELLVRIFATDVATDAVEFARRGLYPAAAVAELPTDLLERHLIALDGAYEVRKDVRALVVFGEHDLGYRAPFPRIDLVLCRNVLIYFTAELQRRTLQLFAFSLRQGGCLALGKAETVSPLPEFFTVEQPRLKVFRRVGEAAPIPAASLFNVSPFETPTPRHGRRTPAGRQASSIVNSPQGRELSPHLHAARLMDRLSTGIATIDRQYHIRSINSAGRRLMGIHTVAIGEDVIHRVAPALAGPLREVLDLALRGEPSTVSYHVPDYLADDDERDLMISAYPTGAAGSPAEEAVLEVVEITTLARLHRESSTERDRLRAVSERERERAERAATEVRSLRTANETMAAEATRLQAENEELMVANEEAQAAAEEIETLNEELQATNEELETLNEELQATVEELAATNDELQARTVESLEIAAAREADRRQLEAILGAMSDAVLLVGSGGEPVLSNAAYDREFGQRDSFVPEANVGERLPESMWPQLRAARGESFTASFTMKSDDGSRRWFEANGQPFRLGGAQEGGVVAIRDVTDRSLRRLQEQFLAIAGHELRTPLTALSLSLDLAARKIAALGDLPLKRDIDRALEQTRRLSALAAELSDVGRLQLGAIHLERQPLDLVALTSQVIDSVQAVDKGQQIQFGGASDPLPISADPRRIEQVLVNVLVNAITFTTGKGAIDVAVRRVGDAAELTIRDHGPGIRADALPFIFDRFYRVDDRTASEGLGLGLFISRQIVDAHGGEITATSPPGEGATFTVRLPLLDPSRGDGARAVSSRGQNE